MNARRPEISFLAAALASAGLVVPATAALAATQTQTQSAIAGAEHPAAFPTFGQVPPAPKDVRPIPAWRTAVLALRGDGTRLERQAAAKGWSLDDTEGWAARAHAEATPPAPVTSAADAETDAEVAAMRARAMEPPRSR